MVIKIDGRKIVEVYTDFNKTIEGIKNLKDKDGNLIYDIDNMEIIYESYELAEITTSYILQYYPTIKQQSDQADKEYFSTLLKAKGVENLEADIVTRVQNFFAGSTLDDVIADVADEDKEAYIQIVKVGIRVTWVQTCKTELRNAIAENREPVFPEYPL